MEGLTVWCVGFREVRWVQPERNGRVAIPAPHREIVELGVLALARVLAGRAMVYLPVNDGAGPCGTLARRAWMPRMIDPEKVLHCVAAGGKAYAPGDLATMPPQRSLSPIAWSVQHLIPPLQRYDATRPRKQMKKMGAKAGGGHGKQVLW